jgi:hypothetical protein
MQPVNRHWPGYRLAVFRTVRALNDVSGNHRVSQVIPYTDYLHFLEELLRLLEW